MYVTSILAQTLSLISGMSLRCFLKAQIVCRERKRTVYDTAFQKLAVKVGDGINQQKAYDMSSLLLRYRERLGDKGINADSYSKQRLMLYLQQHFGDNIVSHQYPDKSKPEIIYSRAISVQDVLNAAAQNTVVISEKKASKISDDDNQLLNVTRRIKEDIRKCKGITLKRLNVDDVNV